MLLDSHLALVYTFLPPLPFKLFSSLTWDPFTIYASCSSLLYETGIHVHYSNVCGKRRNCLLFLLFSKPRKTWGRIFCLLTGNVALSFGFKPFWIAIYFIYLQRQRQEPIRHSAQSNFSFPISQTFCRCLLLPSSSSSFSNLVLLHCLFAKMLLQYTPHTGKERLVQLNHCCTKKCICLALFLRAMPGSRHQNCLWYYQQNIQSQEAQNKTLLIPPMPKMMGKNYSVVPQ